MIKNILALAIVLQLTTLPTMPQQLENLRTKIVGGEVYIYFDLTLAKTKQLFDVQVYYFDDSTSRFSRAMTLTGNISAIPGGSDKIIVWDALHDLKRNPTNIVIELAASLKQNSESNSVFGITSDKRDDQTYRWVEIGSTRWLSQNMNYMGDSALCYNNVYENCDLYGKLYYWDESLKACLAGWHLPTDDDWKKLEIQLGMPEEQAQLNSWRGSDQNIGGALKAQKVWRSPNTGADNRSYFSALPAGLYNGRTKSFRFIELQTFYWSATQAGTLYAWCRILDHRDSGINRLKWDKTDACSVRCVRNE